MSYIFKGSLALVDYLCSLKNFFKKPCVSLRAWPPLPDPHTWGATHQDGLPEAAWDMALALGFSFYSQVHLFNIYWIFPLGLYEKNVFGLKTGERRKMMIFCTENWGHAMPSKVSLPGLCTEHLVVHVAERLPSAAAVPPPEEVNAWLLWVSAVPLGCRGGSEPSGHLLSGVL